MTQIITVGITQLGGAAVTEDAVAAQAEAGMKLVGPSSESRPGSAMAATVA